MALSFFVPIIQKEKSHSLFVEGIIIPAQNVCSDQHKLIKRLWYYFIMAPFGNNNRLQMSRVHQNRTFLKQHYIMQHTGPGGGHKASGRPRTGKTWSSRPASNTTESTRRVGSTSSEEEGPARASPLLSMHVFTDDNKSDH